MQTPNPIQSGGRYGTRAAGFDARRAAPMSGASQTPAAETQFQGGGGDQQQSYSQSIAPRPYGYSSSERYDVQYMARGGMMEQEQPYVVGDAGPEYVLNAESTAALGEDVLDMLNDPGIAAAVAEAVRAAVMGMQGEADDYEEDDAEEERTGGPMMQMPAQGPGMRAGLQYGTTPGSPDNPRTMGLRGVRAMGQ